MPCICPCLSLIHIYILMNPVYTGAIASQKKDYRFKIGTIGEKKPQDWIVVEERHEPIVDRKSFDIVQDKLKSRQRSRQTGEISLFAGLLKCGECGKSLTIRYTNDKHPKQIYSCKMCIRDRFKAVKQSVTTRQAAEHFGIRVGRNGMCVCPFHADKNPSMKVDRRFHCFGCQADGDVIDFVSRLENVSPREAALMLAQDFFIPYEDKEPPSRSRPKRNPRKESPEQQFKRMERYCFRVLSDYHNLLRRWKRDYAPKTPEEEWHPLFVEALQKQSHVEYLLDVLLFSDIGERAALIASYGKEVRNLERRMADLAARTAAGRDGHHRSRTPAPER